MKLPTTTVPSVSRSEYVHVMASRLYFSKCYRGLYFSMIVASLVGIVWTLMNKGRIPDSVVFISFEIVMSVLLVFEVLIRMFAQKRKFWRKWTNVFDIFVVAISLTSIVFYFQAETVVEELEEVAADSILAIRNAIQYGRLVIFLRNRKLAQQSENVDIDFASLYPLEEDEEETLGMLEAVVIDEEAQDFSVQLNTAAEDDTAIEEESLGERGEFI